MEEESYSLDQIQQYFTSPQELLNYINQMEYFDENLNPIWQKWSEVGEGTPMREVLKANREFHVQRKMLNIHKYLDMKDGFSKENFKMIITKKQITYKDEADEILGHIDKIGVRMKPEEWEQYEEVFHQIFERTPDTIADES